jgi:hypothetical protein
VAALGALLAACGDSTGPGNGGTKPDVATQLVVLSGDDQTVMAGSQLPEPIVIEARTEAGTPAKGVTVLASGSGGVISPSSATTGADGRLSYQWELPDHDGQQTATFTVSNSTVKATARITLTPRITLTHVDGLTPNATATLHGSGLLSLSEIRLDGVTVPLIAGGTNESRTFVVPQLVACETDGRPVQISVSGAALEGRMQVAAARQLEPGQSIVLAPKAGDCIQLPAGDHDYVVTAVNTTIMEAGNQPLETLLRFTTGFGSAATGASRAVASLSAARASFTEAPASPVRYSSTPASVGGNIPFDPKYVTAKVGDTVRFANAYELRKTPDYCNAYTREEARASDQLSYPVEIAAIAGGFVIAVDLRVPEAAKHLTPTGKAELQRAAETAEPVLLRAIRNIITADAQLIDGPGGRHYFLISSAKVLDPSQPPFTAIAGDAITGRLTAQCALSSGMHSSVYDFSLPDNPLHLASVMVHEYTHNVAAQHSNSNNTASAWWLTEPLAVNAQETAARMASNQPTNARLDRLAPNAPYEAQFLHPTWGNVGRRGFQATGEQYRLGALFYLLLREQAGDAGLEQRSPTLYQRIFTPGSYYEFEGSQQNLKLWQTVERVMGKSAAELLDYMALAAATDDLVDPAAVAKHKLPQIQSWDSRSLSANRKPSRTQSRMLANPVTLEAAPTGYDAAYYLAEHGIGLSLSVSEAKSSHTIVRVTRLR